MGSDLSRKQAYTILAILVLLGLLVRFWGAGMPIYESSATRQEMTASVARNFYLHGYSFFKPTIDFPGRPYQLYLEVPIYQYLVSKVYGIFGQAHTALARGVNSLFGVGMILLGFAFAFRAFGSRCKALWTAGIIGFAPFMVTYTRTVQPDTMAVFFSFLALYMCYLWHKDDRTSHFIVMTLAASVALLTKPQSAYIGLPMLMTFWHKYSWKSFKTWKFWFLGFVSVVPLVLWLSYAREQYLINPQFGWGSMDSSFLFQWKTFFRSKLWHNLLEYLLLRGMTPLVLIWFVRGLIKKPKCERFFYWWLYAIVIYMIVFVGHIEGHKYYYLPIILMVAFFAGSQLGEPYLGLKQPLSKALKIVCIVVTLLAWVLSLKSTYILKGEYAYAIEAQEALKEVTQPDDLIVSSRRIYYTERSGWILALDGSIPTQDIIEELKRYEQEGARHFLVSNLNKLAAHPELQRYLSNYYRLAVNNPKYQIYVKRV